MPAPKKIGILLRDIDAYEGYFSISYFLKILPYVFTRPLELRLALWSEFDLAGMLWRIPAKRMKMRKEHIVPLAPQVMGLLSDLHGFRAMASTRLNEMGYRADVIEAQLAHKEPDAVRLAYNRAQYTEERRKMMDEWAGYLDGLKAQEQTGRNPS